MINNIFGIMAKKKTKKQRTYSEVLIIAKEIGKKKNGALFVLGKKARFKGTYTPLFPQVLNKHDIFEPGMRSLLNNLAVLDGAVLVSDDGEIIAFGARLRRSKSVPGFGTRHAAAAGITKAVKGSTAILVSEEVNWVKVFKDGKIVMELDPVAETPPSVEKKVITFLADNDTALITTAGVSAALLGFAPVLVIGGTYLAIKTAAGVIKKNLSKL